MKLLTAFEAVFSGQPYRHRSSTVGDALSLMVFEDLYDVHRSAAYVQGVERRELVVNTENKVTGRKSRRGDGTFGEKLMSVEALEVEGFHVARGKTADVRIGVEVKILATAMIKQIDRVVSDLCKQAAQFRAVTPGTLAVGVVGVNRAPRYRSYEGPDRFYDKPGSTGPAPAAEANEAIARLREHAASAFDEFVVLEFSAPNKDPFSFGWANATDTLDLYMAALQRLSRAYDKRFG